MTVAELTGNFNNNKTFSKEALKAIQEDSDLRGSLVKWFRNNSDRGFAVALLNTFTALRQAGDEIPGEDIMLSAYILGQHGHIEDSLKIWNAKDTDFDAFAMIDIQLVMFAGLQETLSFLKNNNSNEAVKAYKYIEMCMKSGDFDDLATYFSDEETPWYV